MSRDDARRLRAQIPASTDPERLKRMAREAERRAALEDCPYCGAPAESFFTPGLDDRAIEIFRCTRCPANMPTRAEWNRRPNDHGGR